MMLDLEVAAGFPSRNIAGIDEVGRGCLAGPVMTAAALLPRFKNFESECRLHPWLLEVTDSKALSPKKRDELLPVIQNWLQDFSVAEASPVEIDQLNIHHATLLAMKRAYDGLKIKPDFTLIDGKFVPPGLPEGKAMAAVKGDSRSLVIACASVIAKVTRDRMMIELKTVHPKYAFEVHKGYPTAVHKRAISQYGILEIHRKSFRLE